MAIALTAWLMAPAPMAWTSTRPLLRITPAMAPATATGLEVAETFSTSTGARSAAVIAGTSSNVFTVDSLDRCSPSGGTTNGNHYRIESHGTRRYDEPVGDSGQESLEHHVLVHADAPVAGTDHADVGHVGRSLWQHAGVRRRDVGVRPHYRARPPVQVPPHRRLLGRRLRVHVAEDDVHTRVGGQDGIRRPEGVV